MTAQHFILKHPIIDQRALIKKLLRFSDEPYIYIDDIEAHDIITNHTNEFMDLLHEFYQSWASNQIKVDLPVKQVFYTKGLKGDFRVMPCVIESDKPIKSVKVIGTNEENRAVKDKICVGKSLLIDHYDNHIYALLDVCALSSFRTAAISVLCYKLFSPKVNTIGLIGLGRIGFYTAYILHQWLGLSSLSGFDADSRAAQNFQKLLKIYCPNLTFVTLNHTDIYEQSNAVFLSTDSEQPLLNAKNAQSLDFISSVGADANNLSELHYNLLSNKHQIVTDSMHSMLLGDMKQWKQQGKLSENDVVELKDVACGKKALHGKIVFITTGIAVQDALINDFVVKKFKAAHPMGND